MEVGREAGSHGSRWDAMHGGYFSDPSIAASLLEKVRAGIAASSPDVLVDLGGGTGFLLGELIKSDIPNHMRLINLDVSAEQLGAIGQSRISPFQGSISTFRRGDLDDERKRFMFMTRSAFHYAGMFGLKPWLRHVRSQMKLGELLVHQTACFEDAEDALCLNVLYDLLGTGKWYPTITWLCKCAEESGLNVTSVSPAPTLTLGSDSLSRRYGIDEQRMTRIRDKLRERFGQKDRVLRLTPHGFDAYLHYYTCVNLAA